MQLHRRAAHAGAGARRAGRPRRLQIDRGCDRQDPQIDSLVLESSGGHGGSLTLASFDRRPDGDYDLVLLEYNHYQRPRPKDPEDLYPQDSAGPLVVYHRQLPAATMAPLLVRLRATAHLEIVEHEPPPTPGTMSGGAVGTSHNYHVALRLTDRKGRGVQRYFSGYEGSGEEQRDGVPMANNNDNKYSAQKTANHCDPGRAATAPRA